MAQVVPYAYLEIAHDHFSCVRYPRLTNIQSKILWLRALMMISVSVTRLLVRL